MKTLFFALAALAVSSLFLHADDAAVAAKMARIPAPAAEALKKAAGSAKIETLAIEKDGKVTIYEVELVEAGQPNREVSVKADGSINAEEETVPMQKVPEAARKAIEAGAKESKIERVQKIKRAGGVVTFEALYVKKGKKTEVEYLEDGKLKPEEK
ncbi:MAG: hypothetical protein JWL90_1620 [Chthoniobacteraceae bacterium]|nr:hypothetical protein [Chthoniobacteraceae bacterium]